MNTIDSAAVRSYLVHLQKSIVGRLEEIDGKAFVRDEWTKPADSPLGGSGVTRILEGGNVFERAGVGFSHVTGHKLPPSATAARPELNGRGFEAMGVSLVLHPHNPYVPTVHMNVRFFIARVPQSTSQPGSSQGTNGLPSERRGGGEAGVSSPSTSSCNEDVWWFGGGMDLTPYYGFEEDAGHFHTVCRDAVAPFGGELYPRFKTWCDDYFFLKHRNEARGVGGIFFDDFHALPFEQSFALQRAVGDAFLPAYQPIVERRRHMDFGPREREFQLYRRGRYVEFNLVFDRGTHFGLQSGGRSESILMSMPPKVEWRYDWQPAPGSPEARLYTDFLPRRDWV